MGRVKCALKNFDLKRHYKMVMVAFFILSAILFAVAGFIIWREKKENDAYWDLLDKN